MTLQIAESEGGWWRKGKEIFAAPLAGALEKAALNGLVQKTLHPDVQIPVNWT